MTSNNNGRPAGNGSVISTLSGSNNFKVIGLKSARERLGLSIKEFAIKAGVRVQDVSLAENNYDWGVSREIAEKITNWVIDNSKDRSADVRVEQSRKRYYLIGLGLVRGVLGLSVNDIAVGAGVPESSVKRAQKKNGAIPEDEARRIAGFVNEKPRLKETNSPIIRVQETDGRPKK
jgi:transcriptional regulator with XRE-family HTH domain